MGADNLDLGSGEATLINCTLTGNSAFGGVGGAANFSTAGVGGGGALFNLDGLVHLTNDTLASNNVGGRQSASLGSDGGAFYNLAYGHDIRTGSALGAIVVLNNCILATTSGGNDAVSNNGQTNDYVSIAGSNNLVMSSGGAGLPAGVILTTANPNLGPLQNNGGPTPTMLPQPNSPVLAAGDPNGSPLIDQRGVARPSGGPIDLGAVQVSTAPNPSSATGKPVPPNAGIIGLAIEEFELTIDMILSDIEGILGMPHSSLDATIAQLQTAIKTDVSFSTPLGQAAVSLGQSLAFKSLSHS
jgi:hypothetical protein